MTIHTSLHLLYGKSVRGFNSCAFRSKDFTSILQTLHLRKEGTEVLESEMPHPFDIESYKFGHNDAFALLKLQVIGRVMKVDRSILVCGKQVSVEGLMRIEGEDVTDTATSVAKRINVVRRVDSLSCRFDPVSTTPSRFSR